MHDMLQCIQDRNLLIKHLNAHPNPGTISIDTEFARFSTYYPLLSLLQLNIDGCILVVDALKVDVMQLKCFTSLLENPKIIKILHGGQQDASMFEKHNIYIKSAYDINIALRLANFKPGSYQGLVEKLYNIKLNKAQQRNNWLKRPLTKNAIQYAANDVRYLPNLFKFFNSYMRTDWVMQETHLHYYEPTDAMRPLYKLRLALAKKHNVPVKSIMSSACISALSELEECTPAQVQDMLPQHLIKELPTIMQYLPSQKQDINHNVYNTLQAYLRQISEQLSYNPVFVCKTEWLIYVIATGALPIAITNSWRKSIYGNSLIIYALELRPMPLPETNELQQSLTTEKTPYHK